MVTRPIGNQRMKSCLSKFVRIDKERIREVKITKKYFVDLF